MLFKVQDLLYGQAYLAKVVAFAALSPRLQPNINISAIIEARVVCSLALLAGNTSSPRAWLNKYVQAQKMVGKNTHQVQLGEKQ